MLLILKVLTLIKPFPMSCSFEFREKSKLSVFFLFTLSIYNLLWTYTIFSYNDNKQKLNLKLYAYYLDFQ